MTNATKQESMASSSAQNQSIHKGVVTFLDILGWKGIYNRESTPITKLSTLIRVLENVALQYRGLPFTPNIHSISDTIVIHSGVTDTWYIHDIIEIHGEICAKAIVQSILAHIPVRGATTFGEYEVQDNIYVGKAIDEAASWYESCDWIGVHLTPSTLFAINPCMADCNWLKYTPPIKKEVGRHETLCVKWLEEWKEAMAGRDPRQHLQSVFRDMGPITPDLAMKFINTLAYFDKMLEITSTEDEMCANNSAITVEKGNQ